MSIRTKIVIFFSALFLILIGGFGILISFEMVKAKEKDAKLRVVSIISLIHNAKMEMKKNQFEDFLKRLLHTRFKGAGYSMDIASIKIKQNGKEKIFKKDIKPERTKRFKTIIKNPKAKSIDYEMELEYLVTNLHRDIGILLAKVSLFGIILLGVAILGISLLSHRITSPLKKLIKGMKKVPEGDFGIRIETKSKDEVGKLAETFNWMVKGLEEGEFVKNIFKRYVTRQVAEKIISEKEILKLKGDRRKIAVLFGDIRNFTTISKDMSPEEVFEFLNFYFAPVIDIIFVHEGILDKFIGDGFLAFWNAPVPQEDYVKKAVNTAIEIQNALKNLNKERGMEVKMGIGINVGYAIAGNVGSSKRMEYTVIGDTVNFAERLQEAARDGEIFVSKEVYEMIKTEFECEKRRAKVEGYGEIEIYEVKTQQGREK